MHRKLTIAATAALALSGCTHFGTNIAGNFSCRTPKAGCQPLSEVDASAVRQLLKSEGSDLAAGLNAARTRIGVAISDNARTSERTLKVVFPAHVDGSGTLHEDAVAWAVVEAARWTGELRGEVTEPKGTMRALRQALKDQARRAAEASPKAVAEVNPKPLLPEDSAPAELANPFIPSSPSVLPSPGGEEHAGMRASDEAEPAAGGSDMSPTPHERAPRPLEEVKRVWPSAAVIEAAKALKAKAGAATKDPK